MPVWKLAVAFMAVALMLVGCGRDDPEAALQAAVESLQESIESKDTSRLMDLIHQEFSANQEADRDWARRTATLMFLRHRNVNVIALNSRSWIDPTYPDKGYSEAQVALTGAEALLPQRLGHYNARLEWWLADGKWQLARLNWD
ncbi:hypothetical protein CXF92_05740 [Pseudomonas sp. Choline-3u-10]|jgi:hypothetical protein|uniref:hypothetical protein n=1 Tax=Pseudomonadaceae TaxID=135621 RepID=UPI000535D95D|nr:MULTISPECIES: hypothetical protein [Pseudomonadaceae]MAL37929.1 hypothetical protein [Pseudomonas sp.]MBU0853858.1 hypothetical protein [Gammaproteobacteria bacterium]BAP77230.1 hypothetical protein MT1_0054 [Pseudomonas sp. MT-1]KJJ62301.1 hypothetical protein RT21_16250 [Pseudomonas sp. 10B238]MBK3794472.1 hypothetical protein [Stutzerimonas stutzeri]|tara:strand:- start:6530 stop:6961 length:432 start_codon:yes stop_codon:yes gene_type:complete